MKLLENLESHTWLTLEACNLSLWTGLLWWLPIPLRIELRPLTMPSRSRCGTSCPATLPLAYSTLDLLVFSQTARPVASVLYTCITSLRSPLLREPSLTAFHHLLSSFYPVSLFFIALIDT